MMLLGELARLLDARMVAAGGFGESASGCRQDPGAAAVNAVALNDVEHDSRRVGPGTLFACIPGRVTDGHRFAGAAAAAGAVALLAERPVRTELPVIAVPSVRRAVGTAAAAVHGNPCEHLQLVGVTGTNGKTTTVRLLAGLLARVGSDVAEIGTLTGTLTTPEATDLQRTLAGAARRGAGAAVMEASSHGLAQHRLNGCRFRVVAFTNLGHDHLDFHGSVEDYFEAKARLFSRDLTEQAVIDVSTGWGRRLALLAARDLPVTEVDRSAAETVAADAASTLFRWRGHTVKLRMGGSFNQANAVLAAETAVALGLTPAEAAEGLSAAAPVPGRFEAVDVGQDFAVLVDYAHTPDGLAAALRAARAVTGGQLTVVFGAGGERDPSKRPVMGAVAEELADRVILTSDNPRGEDPARIIDEVAAGMSRPPARREPDRRRGLRCALAAAGAGDTVVIAGKGHETSQTVGDRVLSFDDRIVAAEELERLAGRPQPSGVAR